jgi:aspartate/tyrosine/aromatic aminotransferase
MQDCGLEVKRYRYYNPNTLGLDYQGFSADVEQAPDGSFFVLHTCAHNPTGIDPSPEQWDELSQLFKRKKHVILFDTAYQGFASGDPERDAYSVRKVKMVDALMFVHFVVVANVFRLFFWVGNFTVRRGWALGDVLSIVRQELRTVRRTNWRHQLRVPGCRRGAARVVASEEDHSPNVQQPAHPRRSSG